MYGSLHPSVHPNEMIFTNNKKRRTQQNLLMHSAMGRLGVHKSFFVDVTTHFGSSTPRQNCCNFFFPPLPLPMLHVALDEFRA